MMFGLIYKLLESFLLYQEYKTTAHEMMMQEVKLGKL